MKILKIKVQNYRQYKSLDLDLSKNPDFVVIVGTNGFGKSNLLSAISWCLYGKESKAGKNLHYENSLVNFHTSEQLQPGDSCNVSVELELQLDNGEIAAIRRSQSFTKGESQRVSKSAEQDFQVLHRADPIKGFEIVKEPELWRDRRFPNRLESYFLFDGERLDSFLRDDRASGVERAIMEIAQVDKLEHIKERIEIVRTDISREAGRASKNIQLKQLQEKFEVETEKLEQLVKKLEEQRETTAKVTEKYQEAESIILQMANENAEAQRLQELFSEKSKLEAEDEAAWEQFANWSVSALTTILFFPAILEAHEVIQERRNNKTLPPKYTPDALEEILHSGECICGRSLSSHDKSRQHIESLLNDIALLSGSGAILFDMSPFVLQLKMDAEKVLDGVEETKNKFATRRQRLNALNDSLPKGKPQDLDGTNNPIWRYTELQALHPKSVADLRLAEHNKQEQEKIRDAARMNLENAMKQDIQLQTTSRTLDFSEKVLTEATRILENWKKLVRDQVSEALSTEFAPMLPKDKFIKEVWIDEEFKVHVTSETGNDVVEELSSGERQSLAFAFSFGLNKVSGYALPMVIDTPFGRMGEKMKTQVASALARNTGGSEKSSSQQVIVLMTDTEFSKDVAAKFDSRSPYLLRIRNDMGTLSNIEEM